MQEYMTVSSGMRVCLYVCMCLCACKYGHCKFSQVLTIPLSQPEVKYIVYRKKEMALHIWAILSTT